jgi:uncharacterized protein YndB with AHSA1/START domain
MRVVNSIHIDAPVETVWAITQDVERWPEWTPTVTSVRLTGDRVLRPGAVARIKQPGQPESDWVVTEFVSRSRFAWATERSGLRMVGTHHLSEERQGTRNILSVDATGPIATLLWPILVFVIRKALADENAGLKRRCEAERAR